MAEEIELFNAHQQDVRQRADSVSKAIFVLSGGTLTVSIGIFTNPSAPELTPHLAGILKYSWWSLFSAIIFLVLALVVIIARDYAFGERWRKKINGQNVDVTGNPTWVEAVIWGLALLGLFGFLAGLVGQAYVASCVV